jgi:hypothetical protein
LRDHVTVASLLLYALHEVVLQHLEAIRDLALLTHHEISRKRGVLFKIR